MVRSLPDSLTPLKAAAELALHVLTWRRSGTYRHCLTTGNLARELALKYYDFNRDEREALAVAGYLHDFGKLHIPNDLLSKQGKLEEYEWDEIRRHPILSVDAARVIEPYVTEHDNRLFERTCAAIYCHHCRWDGGPGAYPDKRSGTAIPLWARILSVCDSYAAMTEPDRPWRLGESKQSALEELGRVAGEQLDPLIVEQFCRMMMDDFKP